MTNPNFNCETSEPLISALIDGELDANERNELNSHLQNCSSCKTKVSAFENVDAAVQLLSANPSQPAAAYVAGVSSPAARPQNISAKPPSPSNLQRLLRVVPFAVAATLLICLGIVAWTNPPVVSANQISPAQIIEPMKELQSLNFQRQRDQVLMLRTLGMDLRSMKLEINLLEPGSSERVRLAGQIEMMIQKVNAYETSLESTQ